MSLVNRYIGSPIKRVEDLRFLRGRGEFVADLASTETLHAAMLRSSVAHARIRAIDLKPALAIAGVQAVITAAEIGTVPKIPLRLQPSSATEPFCQPVIAQDRVRYVGEPIAVVLADSAALAENGVEAIVLDLEEVQVVADWSISHRGETLLVLCRYRTRHRAERASLGDFAEQLACAFRQSIALPHNARPLSDCSSSYDIDI